MALAGFLLGPGPFSPALALAVIAVPLALVGLLRGQAQVGLLALYWSAAALAVLPASRLLSVQPDRLLLVLGVVGLVLSMLFWRLGKSAA